MKIDTGSKISKRMAQYIRMIKNICASRDDCYTCMFRSQKMGCMFNANPCEWEVEGGDKA